MQKITFTATGDCKDEEEMIEDESKDNCKIVVKISPTTPTRTAILEQLNDDDEWDQAASARSKAGKITFSIDATDEDDAWLDGDFTFRVTVKKSGTNKAVESDEYTFTFTPAESDESDESDDSGSGEASSKQKSKSTGNTKLDTVLDKMDDKNTTFDDDCKKSFGEDCKLMFTPTGPNWAKLSAAKWQTMCEKLLKQTEANCKLMYGTSAPPPGSGNKDSGAPSKDSGAPSKDSGAPNKDSGAPNKDSGAPNKDSGAPSKDSGAPNKDSGAPNKDSGAPNKDSGAPSKDSGAPSKDSGGSTQQPPSGGPAVTAESIKKACTTAGIEDCTAIVKLITEAMAAGKGPDPQEMGKLLGTKAKAEAFSKAMGFPSQPSTTK